ncbi:MAG: pilin [Parcubacteria group bacterium]
MVPCTDDCTLCHLVLGFKNIYDYLLVLLLSATTLVVVAAGVMYMVSSGDKGMIDKAKSALTYALTAMILALVAWLIINATLSALGYTKVGSWYNFTCDTVQTQGPTGGTGGGGATLPGTPGAGGGSGSYKASGYLSPKAQEVINNYMNTQVGKNYGGDVHCYSTTDAAYTLSGLQDLGGRWKVWNGEAINPGDAMQTSKHTWLVMENGATSNAIPGGKIGVNPDGLTYNLNKAKNLGLQVRIIHVN